MSSESEVKDRIRALEWKERNLIEEAHRKEDELDLLHAQINHVSDQIEQLKRESSQVQEHQDDGDNVVNILAKRSKV